MESHEAEQAKDSTTESLDKHKINEVKEITSPPDFRNILKKFEGTKDIVKVEKVPSSTDILPHPIGPSKVSQLGASEEKNIKTSEDLRAGVQEGNLIIFDDTIPASAKSNVKDASEDTKRKELELPAEVVKDSTEESIGEKFTWKSTAVLKDAGSDKFTVKESDIIQSTSESSATDTVIYSREPRYKIMLIGKNVSQHPLSTTEELLGQVTESHSPVIPGAEHIQEKMEKVITADDISNPSQNPTKELKGQVTETESSVTPGKEDIQGKTENVITDADESNPSKEPRRKKFSLQELEQSFISALNMPEENAPQIDVKRIAKLVASKSLPVIKVTHPSDFENENDSLELTEEIKDKKQAEIAPETQNSDASEEVNLESNTEANIDDRSYEGQSSVGQSVSLEFDEQGCIQRNLAAVTEAPTTRVGQKPFFYISSSELPPELRYRATAVSEASNTSQDQNCRVSQSCLCSKDLHGFIFLIGTSLAILAFAVAALANQGNIPAHYETIGFTVSIISGIFGALSFICYTVLTCFSECTANRYQRLTDAESALPFNRAGEYGNVEESWSSEKERAWRRQNAMSSTRTSEISVRSVSERQALIRKTERIKKDVTELLDTYANIMSELEPVESIEMRALSNENEKKSETSQESPSTE